MDDSKLLDYFEIEQSNNWKVYKKVGNSYFCSTKYTVWKVFRISEAKEK